MEKQHQWWYITDSDYRLPIAVYAASATDAEFYAALNIKHIQEFPTPSPTPPKGLRLEDCFLLGDTDALAAAALEYERAAKRYAVVKTAMLHSWPNEEHYAVMAGALWRQDGFDSLTLEQENI